MNAENKESCLFNINIHQKLHWTYTPISYKHTGAPCSNLKSLGAPAAAEMQQNTHGGPPLGFLLMPRGVRTPGEKREFKHSNSSKIYTHSSHFPFAAAAQQQQQQQKQEQQQQQQQQRESKAQRLRRRRREPLMK